MHVQTVEVPGGSGTVWEQVHLASALRHDRPDVLFSPAYTAPLASGTPNVLTVHDLSFIAHPEWFPLRMRVRQRVLTTMSARRARSVLTVSEFSRGEVVRRLRIDPDRVLTVPHGLTRPAGAAPIGQRPSREPLVLFVGSVFNRRHAPELIRAVAEVARRHQCVRLEIVGDNRTYPWQDLQAIAAEAGIGGQTAIRSYIPDEVLVDLYARAGVFVFLSDYEGFGLTDPTVAAVIGAAKRASAQSHMYLGLLRFKVVSQDWTAADFSPDCHVLPLILPHFCDRLPDQNFAIRDLRRNLAAVHLADGRTSLHILADSNPLEPVTAIGSVLPSADTGEDGFPAMWQLYLQRLSIPERRNPALQMGNMPKKYWKYLTEFQT